MKRPDAADAFGVIGFCLFGAGLWMIYVPGAFLFAGALGLAIWIYLELK